MMSRILLDPKAEDGGGNSDPSDGNNPTAAFQSLLSKHNNDAMVLATKLFDENFQLRSKRRNDKTDFENQLNELKSKMPKGDVKILSDDEDKLFSTYRELGDPESLKQLKSQYEELASWRAEREAEDLISESAKLHGYESPRVLKMLVKSEGLKLTVRETGSGSAARKFAYVVSDDDDKGVRLDQYLEKNHREILPSLKAASAVKASTNRQSEERISKPDAVDASFRRLLGY